MIAAARYLALLALGLWLGGIVYFAAAVAPSAFAVLPTRELAGAIVSRTLTILHYFGLFCGGLALAASFTYSMLAHGRLNLLALAHVLIVLMLALTLVSQFGVGARMSELRAEMGTVDNIPASDSRRVGFNRLHAWSTRLELGVLLLGLVAFGSLVRASTR